MYRIILLVFMVVFGVNMSAFASGFEDAVPYYSLSFADEIVKNSSFGELVEAVINGENPMSENVFQRLINILSGDVSKCASYVISIMAFSILASCVKGSEIRLGGNVSEISYLICYFIIASFLAGVLKTATDTAKSCAEELETFVRVSLPAYIGIVSATGVNTAPSQGIFLVMINVISEYAGRVMIDAFFSIGIITLIGNMSSTVRLTKLLQISRQVLFWVLGFLLTVFAGMTTLSGLMASSSSNMGIRAIKYTVGHAVPLVGGFLADSTDLILASAGVFKNAFGTAGIIILAVICITPVLKLFVMGFMLKITAGLTEPFCDSMLCETVHQVGQNIIHIMVSVLLMTVMFILATAVLMSL